MIKQLTIACLSFVIMIAGATAWAVTPSEIADAMDDRGYTAEVDGNIVYVMSEYAPIAIAIGGTDGDVSYLTYVDDISSDELGYEFLNQFNNEVKFGRAYIDSDGDIAIQMDRNATGGVSLDNVMSDIEVFTMLIAKFRTDIENQTSV